MDVQVGSFREVLAQQVVVFSFELRCQGEAGSQKKIGTPGDCGDVDVPVRFLAPQTEVVRPTSKPPDPYL